MSGKVQQYVPVVTTEAGSCLTSANWHEVNVKTVACYLDDLLLKPGADLLKKIDNLAAYLGWPGTVILNASRLLANKEGIFTLISPFDGARIKFNYSELFELVNNLKPDVFLVPKNAINDAPELWETLDNSIIPYIPINDLVNQACHKPHGVYFNFVDEHTNQSVTEYLSRWSHLPSYMSGKIPLNLIHSLRDLGVEYIESDEPALSAFQGTVYSGSDTVDLIDSSTELQFDVIDPDCDCPTCSQQLTKAYLHHLYLHTPLLCQRFLIQHNVFQAQRST
ncbi:queuine tRNA-ribosyltransferase [Legionella quateirensis]|uniref:Queuine tRNA-ribosyltransferase n=1 Tax=Legionella quateirensis TaxID=45072 RepID=A0A378KUL4_9GAMM|nr:queuine tRNA-ribosyltransferase [Legionella quateirensis]KTD43710.1 queuine tRNA-ribosyltransferase [Legionella quateirensis]STY17301.1 queuine tRNA-ribosyltransferase [Legionella quateirensis]